MKVDDIRPFLSCINYEISQAFYQALGFTVEYVTDDLALCINGRCTFFLSRSDSEEYTKNIMFQLIVLDIEEAFEVISSIKGFDISYQPIVIEHWGKIVYLTGPSGELWHITELLNN